MKRKLEYYLIFSLIIMSVVFITSCEFEPHPSGGGHIPHEFRGRWGLPNGTLVFELTATQYVEGFNRYIARVYRQNLEIWVGGNEGEWSIRFTSLELDSITGNILSFYDTTSRIYRTLHRIIPPPPPPPPPPIGNVPSQFWGRWGIGNTVEFELTATQHISGGISRTARVFAGNLEVWENNQWRTLFSNLVLSSNGNILSFWDPVLFRNRYLDRITATVPPPVNILGTWGGEDSFGWKITLIFFGNNSGQVTLIQTNSISYEDTGTFGRSGNNITINLSTFLGTSPPFNTTAVISNNNIILDLDGENVHLTRQP